MGKRVALIGLDGSGKSANIEKMKRDSDYSDYNFLWVRWKPTLLKPVYMLMEKKVSDKNKNIKMNVQVDGKCGVKQAELNADYNTKAGLKGKIFRNPIMRGTWMFFALVDYFFQFHIKTLSFILTCLLIRELISVFLQIELVRKYKNIDFFFHEWIIMYIFAYLLKPAISEKMIFPIWTI